MEMIVYTIVTFELKKTHMMQYDCIIFLWTERPKKRFLGLYPR